MLGEYPELGRRVSSLVQQARRNGDLFQEVTLRVRFAVRHLLEDRADAARDDIVDAMASWLPGTNTFGNQRAWALWSRTRVELYAGTFATLADQLDAEWKQMQRALVGRIPAMRGEW